MLATIWDGTAKPKNGSRKSDTAWITRHNYRLPYSRDDETDSDEELPDEVPEFSDEPEPPLRRHIASRHAYCS